METGGDNEASGGGPSRQGVSNDRLQRVMLELAMRTDGIDDNDESYDIGEICRFPQVSTSWLGSISRALMNQHVQWKQVSLWEADADCNSTTATQLAKSRSTQDQLVKFFSSQSSALPFSLRLGKRFVGPQNHQILSDCLTHCGPRLVSLRLEIPTNMRMLIVTDTFQLKLPCLLKLSINWSKKLTKRDGHISGENTTKDFSQSILQAILNGTKQLKYFGTTRDEDDNIGWIPELSIENLRLPTTLTTMDLIVKHLDLLVINKLPKLKDLTINCNQDLLYASVRVPAGFLKNVQKSLELLKLEDNMNASTTTEYFTHVELPIMKKLASLEIQACRSSFSTNLSGLEKCMPVLTKITMDVSVRVWIEWLGHTRKFETVKNLQLQLRSYDEPDVGRCVNMNQNQVRMMCAAFPNLHILKAPMNPNGMSVLFRESQQLRKLTVVDVELISCAHRWTAAFLGITPEEHLGLPCLELLPSKFRWRYVQVSKEEDAVSIMNLTELTSFELEGHGLYWDGLSFEAHIVFYLGFMKMPNLSNLAFTECSFKPSPKMIKKWTEEHLGTIKYTCSEYLIDKHVVADEDDDASADEDNEVVGSGEELTSSDGEDAYQDDAYDDDDQDTDSPN